MSFDWLCYLELAESIFCQRENLEINEEAICRCAVSRAYYAAYCYSRNIAEAHMLYERPRKKGVSAHDHLINFFRNDMRMPIPGARLAKLKEWRTASDYDDVIPKKLGSIQYFTKSAFKYAHEIIDFLDNRYNE